MVSNLLNNAAKYTPEGGRIQLSLAVKDGQALIAVRDDGKHAVTHYDTLEAHGQASLLRVNLETGRTHQIRVHFSSLHHPLCGDPMYGSDPELAEKLGLIRQWLHAVSLRFEHPTGRMMQIDSPYPADLQQALDRLREANDGI